MGATLSCPGLGGYGLADPQAGAVHNGGCCAAFAAMTPQQRALKGAYRPAPPEAVRVYAEPQPVEVTTVAQLIQIVGELQRRDEEQYHPDDPEPTIVWVEIGPEDDFGQVMSLISLGELYGLSAGWRPTAAPSPNGR